MPPTTTTTSALLLPAAADMALGLQILRFKAKALRLREELEALADDDDADRMENLAIGGGFERRLRRRVSSSSEDGECTCGRGDIGVFATPESDDDSDEFRSADGGFKLPRLLHPVLERQHATLRVKREAPQMARPSLAAAAPRAPSPSRVLPCVVARAVALRFVQ